MYSENYKTLMKEIKDNTEKWKDGHCDHELTDWLLLKYPY